MTKKDIIETRNDFYIVVENKQIESNCVAIGFKNQGTTSVIINSSLVLNVGDALFSISYDKGFLDKTLYNIDFIGAGNNNLLVIRTYYDFLC